MHRAAGLQSEKELEALFGSWCRYYKLHNLAYEAGPHLVGDASVQAKIAANRDDRMKNVLIDSINNWYQIGGELNMHYNLASPYSIWGSWGLVERIGTDSPKSAAMEALLTQPLPPLSAGSQVPDTLTCSQAISSEGGYFVGTDYYGMAAPQWINFLIRVPASGNYGLRARARANAGSSLKALLNSDQVASWDVANTTWADLPSVTVSLEEGLNVIRMTPAAGGVDLSSITVEAAPRQ
jgi:hypothetical protein